jgi:hypothetical protein
VSGMASVRCDGGEERTASERGLGTTPCSEASLAVRPGTASPPAAGAAWCRRRGREGRTTRNDDDGGDNTHETRDAAGATARSDEGRGDRRQLRRR